MEGMVGTSVSSEMEKPFREKNAKFFVFSRNNAKFRDLVSWGERITDKFTLGFCYFKLVSFFGND